MKHLAHLSFSVLFVCFALANSASAQYTLSTLVTFNGTNGANPYAGLIADASGNLYGTTGEGGASGNGTVFEVTAGTHAVSTLASFNNTNGSYPEAGLLADASGNLYGTTGYGGPSNNGTVFELAVGTHTPSTLASFNGTNGEEPEGSVIADTSGNLYSTTAIGGANDRGTLFEVVAGTHTLTTLATFNNTNGAVPQGSLIADASGNLYGTTTSGGVKGDGTIFEVSAGTHTLSTLVTFNGTNGAVPYSGLLADASGNLYGTTGTGGASGDGTVFEVAAGTLGISTLVSFDGTNGATPDPNLIADANGNLYGTTEFGGANGAGTVFELSPVPEPSSLALAGFSLATVLLARVVQTARRNFRHRAIEVSKTDCVAEFEL